MRRRVWLLAPLLISLVSALASADRVKPGLSPGALASVLRARPSHPLADDRGRVPLTVRLGPGDDAASLGLLEVAPGIGARWVEPSELDAFLEQHRGRRPWVSPPLRLLTDVSAAKWTHAKEAHQKGRSGKGVVVGVIDTGLDVTHPDLTQPGGGTRVEWLLDLANKPLGLHPELEEKFGCTQRAAAPCAVLNAGDIDKLVAGDIEGAVPPSDSVGHGTHVSSIAAGNGGKTKTYVGVAPEATLVAVRVTRSAAGESVTDADLLNAVRFVFDRAEALSMPAVVNISLGGDYGPHDGTSPLEEGLSSFVGPTRPGHAVVVAAGNSGGVLSDQAGTQYGVHTEARTLPRSTTRAELSMPAATSAARGAAYVWVTFQPGDDVKVGLDFNGEAELGPFARGEQGARDEDTGKRPYMAVINGVVGDNSPLTADTNGAVVVLDGTFNPGDRFSITMEGAGTAQLWVQGVGEAEFGSSTGGMLFRNPLKQGTVNVPATHPALLSVGCTLNRLSWPTKDGHELQVSQVGSLKDPPGDTICYFSGAGPNALGVLKPELAAPGGFVVGAMSRDARPDENPASMFSSPPDRCGGLDNCYVADSQHAVASGTSMSAPQVTGAVALLLQQKPTLTQPELIALLKAGARHFEGQVPSDPQSGPGALDVNTSLELLAPTAQRAPTAPAQAKSWLHLSSIFIRPDGRWPVTGTVMLRDADGFPADGFDPASLRLEAPGVRPSQPLTKVAPGLWQFTLTAPPGSGGGVVPVRVRLGGELVLERQLPVAVDYWSIQGMPEPHGGCAVAAPGR